VDDLRESPAVEVVHLLQDAGASVKVFEPYKPDSGLPGIGAAPTLEIALADAEAVILLVNHSGLRDLTPEMLKSLTPGRLLIDTVNGWAGRDWSGAGFKLFRLGVGEKSESFIR
jgi:UDP-N-acetyl-D-mannosaminuronate dehydrogenase